MTSMTSFQTDPTKTGYENPPEREVEIIVQLYTNLLGKRPRQPRQPHQATTWTAARSLQVDRVVLKAGISPRRKIDYAEAIHTKCSGP